MTTSLDPNTWFNRRDPYAVALDAVRHKPDPAAKGADVKALVDDLRAAAREADDEPISTATLERAADYLDFHALVVARASRTLVRLYLAIGLMIALVLTLMVMSR